MKNSIGDKKSSGRQGRWIKWLAMHYLIKRLCGDSPFGNTAVWKEWVKKKIFPRGKKGALIICRFSHWEDVDKETVDALIALAGKKGRAFQLLIHVPSISMISMAVIDPFFTKDPSGKHRISADQIVIVTRDKDQRLDLSKLEKEEAEGERRFRNAFNNGEENRDFQSVLNTLADVDWTCEDIISILTIGSPPPSPVIVALKRVTDFNIISRLDGDPAPFPARDMAAAYPEWQRLFEKKEDASKLDKEIYKQFRQYSPHSEGILTPEPDTKWNKYIGQGGYRVHLSRYLKSKLGANAEGECFLVEEYLSKILACSEIYFIDLIQENIPKIPRGLKGLALCLESALFVREERKSFSPSRNKCTYEDILNPKWERLAEDILNTSLNSDSKHIARRFVLSLFALEEPSRDVFPIIRELKERLKSPLIIGQSASSETDTVKNLFIREWNTQIDILLETNEQTAAYFLNQLLSQEWQKLPTDLKEYLASYVKNSGAVRCIRELEKTKSGNEFLVLAKRYSSRPILFFGCLSALIITNRKYYNSKNDEHYKEQNNRLKELLLTASRHSFGYQTEWKTLRVPTGNKMESDLLDLAWKNKEKLWKVLEQGVKKKELEEEQKKDTPVFELKGIAYGKTTCIVGNIRKIRIEE